MSLKTVAWSLGIDKWFLDGTGHLKPVPVLIAIITIGGIIYYFVIKR